MKKYFTSINIVFFIALSLVVLIMFGIIPREFAFLILALYTGFILFTPINKGMELFLRSIPFFIALPITQNFDNFNIWRIVLLSLFLKWAWDLKIWKVFFNFKTSESLKQFFNHWSIEIFGVLFFLFAALSLLVAPHTGAGIKRIIFIANASFLFIILRSLIILNKENFYNFAKNFAYSGLLAVFFGYLQFISAYFTEAWEFHYWWGQVVSLGFYGSQWADIATNFGNTWFSYSGETLRLRMFSTFPDSHSFPMYVIMTLPALMVLIFKGISNISFSKPRSDFSRENLPLHLSKKSRHRQKLSFFTFDVFQKLKLPHSLIIATLVFINLALILSGTRGIWLSSFATLFVVALFKFVKIDKKFIKITVSLFLLFLILFPLYFVVVSFRQFEDTDFTASASLARFRSLIDFGETSNQGRIYIWKKTLEFSYKSPIFGIGIGNYPLILSEPQSASKAGSSAHNFYLHLLSTIGIFGLLVFLGFIFEIMRKSIDFLKHSKYDINAIYIAVTLFSLSWISAYLMTDAALYDGRALLAFMAMLGMSAGLIHNKKHSLLSA